MSIRLSQAQVQSVVREAAGASTFVVVLAGMAGDAERLAARVRGLDDRRLSRSLLTGLLVIAAMPPGGALIGVVELARLLGLNTSTAHRYVSTLEAAGVLRRDPQTRRYALALRPTSTPHPLPPGGGDKGSWDSGRR
jgi:hypothetical protein